MRLVEIAALVCYGSKRRVFARNKVNAFLKPGNFTEQVWGKARII